MTESAQWADSVKSSTEKGGLLTWSQINISLYNSWPDPKTKTKPNTQTKTETKTKTQTKTHTKIKTKTKTKTKNS